MFIKRNNRTLREWWQSPVTMKDRAAGALVGGFGGFWIGVLGRIGLGTLPVSFSEVTAWACVITIFGASAGIAFPKPVAVVLFPFSIFGGGN
ncbi:hypothetical protein [Thiopseudomonas acetoxidans]|uniref:Uncharacterized protein n=1 Tax=Thiopseudomonas acetoxidans TaxID=3041622 RepID=A0ABT7SNX9_9GAMM|nr:hypothetical protein [Thiopseudomonas sp. CY1220]MDM7857898.1 hypothetical protein [Thiopseudomonas sp. CY1220]NLC10190.1 hypothetical protein [Gammaproteobacteria bacterium]